MVGSGDERLLELLSCSYRVLQHAFDVTTNSSVAVRATARRNRHSVSQPRYVTEEVHFLLKSADFTVQRCGKQITHFSKDLIGMLTFVS